MLLGIDLGTSKVAAVIVNAQRQVLAVAAQPHHADLPAAAGFAEQDAEKILEAAYAVILKLPPDLRQQCRAVGVTGQMHGVVVLNRDGKPLTPLINWQDQRCLAQNFAADLSTRTGYPLRTGFGCATLAWLIAHKKLPSQATATATIHDLLVARLCGEPRPVTDPTDAASWGLFDLSTLSWDQSALVKAGLPLDLLPRIQPCASRAGQVQPAMARRLGLPVSIPVMTAIGDNQASLSATLSNPEQELALTLGTGGQLSAVLPVNHAGDLLQPAMTYEYRPFPGNRWALVAACLCGGSAWIWLFETVQVWLRDLGAPPLDENSLYQKLNELGLASTESELNVGPSFLGERHAAERRGSIEGVDLTNFTLGSLARGLARGILQNLHDMLPPKAYTGRTRLVASGNALRKNPLLAKMAEEVFGLPLIWFTGKEEAAAGAALLAAPLAI